MKKQQDGFTAVEVIIVLVVIGLIAGVGFVVMGRKDDKATPAKTTNAQSSTPIASDAGSCFGVSKATIKSLLGAPAAHLQDLSDTKTQDIGKGDTARTCVYTFAAGAKVDNSFTMDLGTYASQANLEDSQKYIPETGGAVTGVGESATFAAKDATLTSSRDFVLTVHQDLKIYKFSITQPLNALTFNDASAQRALIQIAQAATL